VLEFLYTVYGGGGGGGRNRVGIGLSYRPARLQAGGIDSLESIPGLSSVAMYVLSSILHSVHDGFLFSFVLNILDVYHVDRSIASFSDLALLMLKFLSYFYLVQYVL
jgi:hypothetical protein